MFWSLKLLRQITKAVKMTRIAISVSSCKTFSISLAPWYTCQCTIWIWKPCSFQGPLSAGGQPASSTLGVETIQPHSRLSRNPGRVGFNESSLNPRCFKQNIWSSKHFRIGKFPIISIREQIQNFVYNI